LLPECAGPRSPSASRWARALAALPNRKFGAARTTLQACGLLPTHGADQALAAHVEFVYGYYARLALLADAASRRRLQRSVAPQGGEHLQRALGLGRGLVLVSAHLGEFDLAGSWLAEQAGCQVVAVVDPVAEAARQRLFDGLRGRSGILLRRRDQTSLADLEADLGRGRAVLIMLDRAAPSVRLHGALLGRPARLSVAPAALARRASAPMLVASTMTKGAHERVVRFSAVSTAERAPDLLAELADELGRHIAACPWQWHIPARLEQLPFIGGPASSRHETAENVGWRRAA
jgi:lauroyl/myristoyl acyltransferase